MIIGGTSTLTYALGAAVALLFILCMYLINVINGSKKYGYLTNMMGLCMQKHRPLGLIVDRSGNVIPISIEKNEKNKGLIKHELTLVHPDMDKAPATTRMRIRNGPDMVIYNMPYFFPNDIGSSAALNQVAENIRHDPDFNWFPSELVVIQLLFNGTSSFERDAKNAILDVVINGYPIPDSWCPEIEEEAEEEYIEEGEEE